MKKALLMVATTILFAACRKNELPDLVSDPYVQQVSVALKDSLPAEQYASLDFFHSKQTHVDSAHLHFLRIPFRGKSIATDFVIVQTDAAGHIQQGRQVCIEQAVPGSFSFNRQIHYRTLSGNALTSRVIVNGHLQKQSSPVQVNNSVVMMQAAEPEIDGGELPEVIVYATIYNDGGISWTQWYSLTALLGSGGGGGYGGGDYFMPGDGGGGSTTAAIRIDMEYPESKTAIDTKKYLNCFGTIPDAGSTFTITIATDIPVDSDPSQFFNWNDASPGHTYIELYKSGNGGLIEQNIGFYPNSSWKVVTGGNIASKMADDAGHEYNARYTISLSASQFQAALNAVQTFSSFDYNVASFNCTDFALNVFNAAGGNLSIPKYQIPGFGIQGGSNTPQGLYNQLQNMQMAGASNIQTNGNKAYGGGSHGPCN
ncbi:MAG: hypothetical protein J0I09_07900 [Sphingobacteriia bacterium]|nr:hypothetical protein [Sphingobacteriia bacterium]